MHHSEKSNASIIGRIQEGLTFALKAE